MGFGSLAGEARPVSVCDSLVADEYIVERAAFAGKRRKKRSEQRPSCSKSGRRRRGARGRVLKVLKREAIDSAHSAEHGENKAAQTPAGPRSRISER